MSLRAAWLWSKFKICLWYILRLRLSKSIRFHILSIYLYPLWYISLTRGMRLVILSPPLYRSFWSQDLFSRDRFFFFFSKIYLCVNKTHGRHMRLCATHTSREPLEAGGSPEVGAGNWLKVLQMQLQGICALDQYPCFSRKDTYKRLLRTLDRAYLALLNLTKQKDGVTVKAGESQRAHKSHGSTSSTLRKPSLGQNATSFSLFFLFINI